jgi:hypothetical protein
MPKKTQNYSFIRKVIIDEGKILFHSCVTMLSMSVSFLKSRFVVLTFLSLYPPAIPRSVVRALQKQQ